MTIIGTQGDYLMSPAQKKNEKNIFQQIKGHRNGRNNIFVGKLILTKVK